jgi:hypothetical protein
MNTTERELLERCRRHIVAMKNVLRSYGGSESFAEEESVLADIEAHLAKPTVSLATQILAITTAYEQGFGKGEQRVVCDCPYTAGDWLGCDVAWNLGYEEGKTKRAKPVHPTNQYEQAIDDELVNSFLGTKDDFKDAKSALLAIIDWTRQVALDPAVSPEAAKLLAQAKPVQEPVAWSYQEYKRVFMDFNWFDEVAFIQPPSDSEQFRNVVPLYISPQRERPPLVQIASDIMGACMNGDLIDKWEDVADLLVSNNFDGLSKLTQLQEPMSDKAIDDIWGDLADSHGNILERDITRFARAIEAHHGIK